MGEYGTNHSERNDNTGLTIVSFAFKTMPGGAKNIGLGERSPIDNWPFPVVLQWNPFSVSAMSHAYSVQFLGTLHPGRRAPSVRLPWAEYVSRFQRFCRFAAIWPFAGSCHAAGCNAKCPQLPGACETMDNMDIMDTVDDNTCPPAVHTVHIVHIVHIVHSNLREQQLSMGDQLRSW
jgi:hypothetical protein